MKAVKTFFALLVFAGSLSVVGCAPDESTTQIEPVEASYDDSSYEQEMSDATDAQNE